MLLTGPPGSGKSDLLLRLLARGFSLVADDRVDIQDGIARAPGALGGLLEVRGLGIMRLPYVESVPLVLVVELGENPPRLPVAARHPDLDLPLLWMDAGQASAPDCLAMALDCVLGRVSQVAGAFSA